MKRNSQIKEQQDWSNSEKMEESESESEYYESSDDYDNCGTVLTANEIQNYLMTGPVELKEAEDKIIELYENNRSLFVKQSNPFSSIFEIKEELKVELKKIASDVIEGIKCDDDFPNKECPNKECPNKYLLTESYFKNVHASRICPDPKCNNGFIFSFGETKKKCEIKDCLNRKCGTKDCPNLIGNTRRALCMALNTVLFNIAKEKINQNQIDSFSK